MKNISGYIFSILLLVTFSLSAASQDTLRTFGPRIGIDLARFAYLFVDPAETGAELSLDMEVIHNLYPVLELGFSSLDETEQQFDYSMTGAYGRFGADFNILQQKDRSVHHSVTVGGRYGVARFQHRAENVTIPSGYWGDYLLESHEYSLTGHWLELVGAVKAEIFPNFFMGWSLRYKILLNPNMDPLFAPLIVPGYGRGAQNRSIGINYSIFYKIPLFKK
ncbi:MAG: DUF6048 family protein [Bacteroidales bacterium]